MSRYASWILVAGFCLCSCSSAPPAVAPKPATVSQSDVQAEPPTPPVKIGQDAPDFTVVGLDGQKVKLSSFRGKPVFLDFWATWCGPCRESLPHTQKVDAEHGKQIAVLAITDDPVDKVKPFLKENSYTTLRPYIDSDDRAHIVYGADAIPTFVLIDAKGKIVDYERGYGGNEPLDEALAKVGVKMG